MAHSQGRDVVAPVIGGGAEAVHQEDGSTLRLLWSDSDAVDLMAQKLPTAARARKGSETKMLGMSTGTPSF